MQRRPFLWFREPLLAIVTGVKFPNVTSQSEPVAQLGPPLFENVHVVVVDKPAGWLSVPSRIGADDARPCVGRVLEKVLATRLWPVHRLDVEVGGLLVFAKDAAAHRLLCGGFESHSVQKTYLAWTCGDLPHDASWASPSRWQALLLRGKKRAYVHPAGKESVTLVSPLHRVGDKTLWRLCPQTGRPHQLRVELARRQNPILGDVLYGSTKPWTDGIALRAVELDLSALQGREQLALPAVLSLVNLDYVQTGMAWLSESATSSGHSIQSACPTDGMMSGAG